MVLAAAAVVVGLGFGADEPLSVRLLVRCEDLLKPNYLAVARPCSAP